MGMGHSFTVPVNWHFHPQSRSFVDPGDIKNSPRHSIDRGSLSLVAFVQSGCIVVLSTCFLLSLLFSPLLLLSWRSASGPRTVHQNASDLTKLDARLLFYYKVLFKSINNTTHIKFLNPIPSTRDALPLLYYKFRSRIDSAHTDILFYAGNSNARLPSSILEPCVRERNWAQEIATVLTLHHAL
ncbi:hypothetical protein EAG_11099 [Camponotus floridanus]|uniref:Uncharacterized protein n=1 Tax=Camponotus floridanus TaxID=104421 RepID=E1ZW67_CAMFO|nr:hypothetical protein EAG_11099 [Camponotus floridanus]